MLGLADLEPEERIQRLLTIPLDEVIAKIPPYIAFMPTVDGDILPCRPTFAAISDPADESMPGKRWADGLMIGDSQFDVSPPTMTVRVMLLTPSQASTLGLLMGHLKPDIRTKFSQSMRSSLSSTPEVAESLLESYGFKSTPLKDSGEDDEVSFIKFLHFCTDMGYYAATTSFARGWPSSSKVLTFFFNEPNPWPGPFQGQATHVLDVVFLFQNYNDKLPPAQRAAAEAFAVDLMRFVAGQDPWQANTTGQRHAKVFGPSTGSSGSAVARVVGDAESAETGRTTTILDLGRQVGLDKLSDAFRRFQMGL